MSEHDAILDTINHIRNVQKFLNRAITDLISRACEHDFSKFSVNQWTGFREATSRLKNLTYGSEEYKAAMRDPDFHKCVKEHQVTERHHPEHFNGDISQMTLVDLLEMVLDWKAASMRNKDGDIKKSIELNKERFGIHEQLVQILKNTVDMYGF